MLDRAQVRFWAPVVACAGLFPMFALLMCSVWFIRSYIGLPAATASTRLAGTAPVVLHDAGLDVAGSPPAVIAEPAAAPAIAEPAAVPAEQPMPEVLTTMEMVAAAHSAYSDRKEDVPRAEVLAMAPERLEPEPIIPAPPALPQPGDVALELPSEQAEPRGVAETGERPAEEGKTDIVLTLPMFATFAVAPPTQFSKHEQIPLPKPRPPAARTARPLPVQLLAPESNAAPRSSSGDRPTGLD
jgi:hypothetical protein